MGERRPTLGVVAISRNEERDLPGLVENLRGWVDEVVVVDDGSSDGTAEVAARYEWVRFVPSPRTAAESWADQRNKGIRAATSDWLLHLDIDHRIPASLAREILTVIRRPAFDAYRFGHVHYALHRRTRGGPAQRWNQARLARRETLRFEGRVHERIVLDCSADRIGQLEGRIWHLNDESWEERMRKSLAYTLVEAELADERGRKARWYHLLLVPPWRSFKTYVLRGGCRDGVVGLIYALHAWSATFHEYALLWDRQHRTPREELERRSRRGLDELPGRAASSRIREPSRVSAPSGTKPRPTSAAARAPTPYDEAFYERQCEGSLRSARAVLPLVLELYRPRRALDLGCGLGTWLSVLLELGVEEVLGVDGDHVDRSALRIPAEAFEPHDLTRPFPVPDPPFDLALCLEVAEHLPAGAAETVVASLAGAAPVVLFSAAAPFQGGAGHVHERWPSFWAKLFEKEGLVGVDAIRPRIWRSSEVMPWYAQNLLLFCRPEVLAKSAALRAAHERAPELLDLVHPRIYESLVDPRTISVRRAFRYLLAGFRRRLKM